MTFRLLPKDVRFFELFVADGENLHAAAVRLHQMVTKYENVDEHVAEIQTTREGRRRHRPTRSAGSSRTPSSRRSTARTSSS